VAGFLGEFTSRSAPNPLSSLLLTTSVVHDTTTVRIVVDRCPRAAERFYKPKKKI